MKRVGPGRRASVLVALAVVFAGCEGGGTDAPRPTTAVAASATSQTALAGTAVAEAPAVRVVDQQGQPMAGVAVTFVVSAGGGSVLGGTAVTNAAGVAASGGWTLGSAAGQNVVTATVGSLAPVQFTATAQVDPCSVLTSYTLFATVQASLAATDCRLEGGFFADIYGLALPTAQRLELRMSSAVVDSWLELYDAQGGFVAGNDDVASGNVTATVSVYAPAGSYFFAATTAFSGEVGAYQISSATFAENVGCDEYWMVPGVTVPGTISATDCDFGAGFTDEYLLVLQAGQTITVRMESAQFDPVVELYDVDGLVASNDNGGGGTTALLTYTATEPNLFFLDATTSAAGQTGAYTLTVTRPAAAGAQARAAPAPAERVRRASARAYVHRSSAPRHAPR